jgi:hypothetical protein
MGDEATRPPGFDGAAAVTRSLLGWGVVAGPFYLAVGIVLGVTRDGFDLAAHPLSLLMLGDGGWMQRTNLILAGSMTLAAALGVSRAMTASRVGRRAASLVGVYGVCLVLSGVFPPDPMAGFPPGSAGDEASLAGILHLAFGAIGFLALAAAAFAVGSWSAEQGGSTFARGSRVAGVVVLVGFLAGAALATQTIGVVALWVAVVTGWAWLAAASLQLYRTVPHPDPDRRLEAA